MIIELFNFCIDVLMLFIEIIGNRSEIENIILDENGDIVDVSKKAFSSNVLGKRRAARKITTDIKKRKMLNTINEESCTIFEDSIFNGDQGVQDGLTSKLPRTNKLSPFSLSTESSLPSTSKIDSSNIRSPRSDANDSDEDNEDEPQHCRMDECSANNKNKLHNSQPYTFIIPDGKFSIFNIHNLNFQYFEIDEIKLLPFQ